MKMKSYGMCCVWGFLSQHCACNIILVEFNNSLFIFPTIYDFIFWIYYNIFIYSIIDEPSNAFYLLPIKNNTTIYITGSLFVWLFRYWQHIEIIAKCRIAEIQCVHTFIFCSQGLVAFQSGCVIWSSTDTPHALHHSQYVLL